MNNPFLPSIQAGILCLVMLSPIAALAQDAAASDPVAADAPAATLSVELNDASPEGSGCRLTFLVENGLATDLTSLSLETVVLTAEGRVEQLTLFDFGTLPADRPRVRQFDLANMTCDAIGQVLINGVTACEGAEVETDACMAGLALSSRTRIELLG